VVIDPDEEYQFRTVATIYNACKTKLNTVLVDNGLEELAKIDPGSPSSIEISGQKGVADRSLGIYCNGAGSFQEGFDIDEPPMVQVIIDLLLRDSDSTGLEQRIYKYSDITRAFLNGIDIGQKRIVASQDTTIKEIDKRNRVSFLFIVWFDPSTDLDRQGFDLSLIK